MIVLYIFSLVCLGSVLGLALRRSAFGALILVSELPFLIGLCLYPILFYAEIVSPGVEGKSYLALNGQPGLVAAVHTLCYSLAALVGYSLAINLRCSRPNRIARALTRLADPVSIWRFLVLLGVVIYGIFMLLVGPDVAIRNAAAARGGIFEEFGDSARFLFLKTVGNLSLFAACFIPYIVLRKRGWGFLSLYLLLIVTVYLNSISRSLILFQLIAPALVVMHIQGLGRKNIALLISVLMPISLLTLYFGKPFPHLVNAMISGDSSYILTAYQGEDGLVNAVFRNYEFVWFSVDSGWLWFVENGPTAPVDSLMAIIGVIPSRLLESVDAAWLYYGNSSFRIACVNASQFGLDTCTVPPLITGISAYIAPVAGAIVAGLVKFAVFGRLERMWAFFAKTDFAMTWVPYLLFMLFVGYMSFIPASIARTSFAVIVLVIAVVVGSLRRGLVQGASPHYSRGVSTG
jgi:hypothetical protein